MDYRNLQNSPSLGRLSEADLDGAIAAKFTPLHPVIAFALAPLRPPLPPVFRADLGRQRAFLTRHDALAYDAGWRMHPATCYAELGTPASMGWHDHQQQRMAPVEYGYEGTINDELDADERASDLAYRRAGVRSPASYIPRLPPAPAPKPEHSEAAS